MLNQAQTRLLTEGAKFLGLELSGEQLANFSLYVEELARWSKVTNLISQADPETIIRKHLLDSLAVSPLIPPDIRLLDLGSGAGFPGLVLAMVQPARNVVLIEARRKRVSFLKEAVRKTQSKNVRVFEGRAETLAAQASLKNSFAAVISRATWSLKEFLSLAHPFVANGGIVISMKGPRGEQELHDLSGFPGTLDFSLRNIREYALPFGEERRKALVFAKQCLT
jgi:16S rRNA (guanine527-N7)-methyltransferase